MRRRYVWSPEANALVEVPTTYSQPPRAHYVVPDLPEYTSPVDGKIVSGRRQRRNDLARTGSRPWEGRAAEEKEAARQRNYEAQAQDRKLDEAARRSYYQIPPDRRRLLERGE